jgi:hypothetical protein
MRHVLLKNKKKAAQETAGEFQEETKDRDAAVRTQQTEQMFMGTKLTKNVRVQQDFCFFVTGLEVKPM